jgi:hypothetical protein
VTELRCRLERHIHTCTDIGSGSGSIQWGIIRPVIACVDVGCAIGEYRRRRGEASLSCVYSRGAGRLLNSTLVFLSAAEGQHGEGGIFERFKFSAGIR